MTLDSSAQHGAEYEDVDVFAKTRLDLELVALRETSYYSKLRTFFRPIQLMVWITAILIATGGLFGGLNTMYAAFASRIREMGSLQAIGYSRSAIVVSLVQESLLATAAGALLAAALALLFLDGITVRFSMGAFGLLIDSSVLLVGLAAGLVLGVAGALPPAWRCLRLPISQALKAF
jgi:putative ABC transport system permease protein